MKRLYFAEPVPVELFLSKQKLCTFRAHDSQDISKGDEISFKFLDDTEFAIVKCTDTIETTFRNIEEKYWNIHEKFESEENMLKTYSNWERRKITLDDYVKIICYDYIEFNSEALEHYKK